MFNLPTQERLLAWQQFRQHLDTLSFEQCVYETNNFWNTAPISNQYYCQTLSEQWPMSWQLIIDNVYDDIGKGLGMLYTIYYTKHICELEFVCGTHNSNDYNIVLIDNGKYTLNWNLEVQLNTPTQTKAAKRFAAKELIKRNKNESSTNSYETRWQERINRSR
jgi:hypothetical protein